MNRNSTYAGHPMRAQSKTLRRWQSISRILIALAGFGLVAGSANARSTADKMLKVTTKEDANGVTHFFAHNNEAAEVTATFELKMSNLKCSTNLPYTSTLSGNQTVEVFTLSPIHPGKPWNYNYTDSFTIGNNMAVHDDSFVYQLPYEVGKSYRVTQGYHGEFSHTGPDEFAIDWKMPIGTPVHAARGGIVVKAKGDSSVGGPDRKYQDAANCVLIQHSDGTVGIYAHLMKGGCVVKVGDKVNAGDLIAYSGNTGFTSGPHLHFSVFKTKDGKERVSLPVKFQTFGGVEMALRTGETYLSVMSEVKVASKIPESAGGIGKN